MHDLKERLRDAPWLLPVLVFLLLGTATLFIYDRQKEIELTAFNEELNRASAAFTTEINGRLNLHAQFLRSVQAFSSTHNLGDALAWQTFSEEVKAFEHLPGMYAFAYARALNSGDKAHYTVDMRKRLNNPQFEIYPQGQQAMTLPVTLTSPDTPLMKTVLGFDLLSEPVRREAIQNAIASRDISLSGRITIVNDNKKTPGFALIKAVYRNNMPSSTVAERRAAVSGIVMMAYRIDEFLAPITRNLENRFILQLFDDGDSDRSTEEPPKLLYSSDPEWRAQHSTNPLHHEIQFGNRNWIIHLYPRSDRAPNTVTTTGLILISGLMLSLLLSLLIFHQSTHRQRAENYARQLTSQLRKSEERFRFAAAGTHDGLWDQNLQTGEDYLSPRLGEIFGFTPLEMPSFVSDYERRVLPEDESRRRACLREHLQHGEPYDVEVRIRKFNGEIAWIRIRGEAVRDVKGQVIRLAGSVSDVTQLHLAEEELRAHRDDLQRLVDERTARLENALHQANFANQAKSEFLTNMSHELRTPMHAIISFATLGQNRAETAQDIKQKMYFDRIVQSANRLLALINDLLDLSKLESGRQPLTLTTVDLFSLVKTISAHLESLITGRQLTLQIETGNTAEQTIRADHKRIEQVLHNLLSNAVKFSPAGGVIRVHFHEAELPNGRRTQDAGTQPALKIQVIDNGPGIPEGELEAIFDKFYQSSLTKTGAGGTGLGLAICREAVQQHHGTITATNNQAGGAMFTVTLPANFLSKACRHESNPDTGC